MAQVQPVFQNTLNLSTMKQPETILTNVETFPKKKGPASTVKAKGQETLLLMLNLNPRGAQAKETAAIMLNLYFDEFGRAWTVKEIEEAKKNIKKSNKPGVWQAVESIIKAWSEPIEINPPFWVIVGPKRVGHVDYAAYCKGLYWLAGFELLNK